MLLLTVDHKHPKYKMLHLRKFIEVQKVIIILSKQFFFTFAIFEQFVDVPQKVAGLNSNKGKL